MVAVTDLGQEKDKLVSLFDSNIPAARLNAADPAP